MEEVLRSQLEAARSKLVTSIADGEEQEMKQMHAEMFEAYAIALNRFTRFVIYSEVPPDLEYLRSEADGS